MNTTEAKQLTPEDHVRFGNNIFKVAGIYPSNQRPTHIEIYDEPPTDHVDRIRIDSCFKVLDTKEVAAKYGEPIMCEVKDPNGKEWEMGSITVNASIIKEVEQGSIRNCTDIGKGKSKGKLFLKIQGRTDSEGTAAVNAFLMQWGYQKKTHEVKNEENGIIVIEITAEKTP